MHQRNAASGRPTGTDGSDFSYRMVVDSRYQKVAKTKLVLRKLFILQAALLVIGLFLQIFLSTQEDSGPCELDIAAAAFGLVSLIIGELGRRRSQVGLLRFFMVVSSFDAVLWMYCAVRRNSKLGTAENPSHWQGVFELPEIVSALLGLLLHMFILGYTIHLIRNMSPPKRAS
ncbi:hypothetical protein SLE2022_022830 [Rubroshorea leprosula]|uniref:Uncharacterized protein n=1 Tax=Rubroshorea leprosula TaxID=152421 RepID=A0AAV5L955_9ROSI|nr:hypothetical protein SLEP1_g42233 [Rubroshorea leprosula]